MKELWTRQAVLSHLTVKCDLDPGSSQAVVAHCKLSHEVNISLFVSSYIKFLQLKELWTGEAILSHLTFNYDLDLGPFYTDSWW